MTSMKASDLRPHVAAPDRQPRRRVRQRGWDGDRPLVHWRRPALGSTPHSAGRRLPRPDDWERSAWLGGAIGEHTVAGRKSASVPVEVGGVDRSSVPGGIDDLFVRPTLLGIMIGNHLPLGQRRPVHVPWFEHGRPPDAIPDRQQGAEPYDPTILLRHREYPDASFDPGL